MTWGLAIFAVAFGGIPFGRLLYTIFGELPEKGGNLPALVLWQRGYPRLAAATALAECLKIWFVYQMALSVGFVPEVAAQALALGLLAHLFSPWLKFKASFAVAPFMGVLLASSFLSLGLGIAVWWQVWRKTANLAWATIATLSCIPFMTYVTGHEDITLLTLPLVLLGLLWQSRFIRI
jgi:glycerol-3-phosphate acyltransferase PlsY